VYIFVVNEWLFYEGTTTYLKYIVAAVICKVVQRNKMKLNITHT
jgi:hypothetical protein